MVQQTTVTTRHARLDDRNTGPLMWKKVTFFFGIPTILAVYAASGHRLLEVLPASSVLVFCLTNALVAWWILGGITHVAHKLLRRWRPHQIVILALGMVLATGIYPPIAEFIDQGFMGFWSTEVDPGHLTRTMQAAHPPGNFLPFAWRDFAFWFVANLFFDRFMGLPRFRYENGPDKQKTEDQPDGDQPDEEQEIGMTIHPDQPIANAKDSVPGFLQRLDTPIALDTIIALKAEQHYMSIYTPHKKYIVLYRFGDAVIELPGDLGLRVHRSWWVRNNAITCVYQGGRKMHAKLVTGDCVPISSPNQSLVRKMAADQNIEIKPLENGCHQ